jgi:hypothetical protein
LLRISFLHTTGKDIARWPKAKPGCGYAPRCKRSFDLVFTPGGIRRWVIECRAAVHECRTCGKVFIPDRYERAIPSTWSGVPSLRTG